jgi:CRISPR-associated protein Cas5d
MHYLVDSIRVIKRGRWMSFRRNEVTKVISLDSAKTWMHSPDKITPIRAGGGSADGTQRNMLALQEVEYLITAEVRCTTLADRPEDKCEKYLAEIERRARSGKCFHRPGLGMREFAADFEWEDDAEVAQQRRSAELGQGSGQFNEDLGLMLYDVFDHRQRSHGFRWLRAEEAIVHEREFESSLTGLKRGEQSKQRKEFAANPPRWTRPPIKPQPAFFHAQLESSCMDCHPDRIHILTSIAGGN